MRSGAKTIGFFALGLVWGALATSFYYEHRATSSAARHDASGKLLHAAVVTNKTVVATPQKLAATAAPVTANTQLKHPFDQYLELDEAGRSAMVAEVVALGGQGVPKNQVVAALQILLGREPDQGIREDILDDIAATGDPAAFEALLGVLQSEAPEAMHAAAMTALTEMIGNLAEAENDAAFEELCRSLDSDLPKEVREAAIEALLEREDKRAIPFLQPLLVDPDEDIRAEAQDAIDYLTDV